MRESSEARARAAAAANERQAAFERSAQGRAANKAIASAKAKDTRNVREESLLRDWQA